MSSSEGMKKSLWHEDLHLQQEKIDSYANTPTADPTFTSRKISDGSELAILKFLKRISPESVLGTESAKILALRNGPCVLLACNNDFNDLYNLLIRTWTRYESLEDVHVSLFNALARTYCMGAELKSWVSMLTIADDLNGELIVDKSDEWLLFAEQLHKLKEQLRENRLRLVLLNNALES